MRLSAEGLQLIALFEGFRGVAYNDQANHATIGYGHLLHFGPVTREDAKLRWSRERALAVLRMDAARFERAVDGLVRVRLTQAQFDALVCFAFNVGIGAFAKSTLLKKLNAEQRLAAANELLRWDKAGGKTSEGLAARRRRERKLFLTGLYTAAGHAAVEKPRTKKGRVKRLRGLAHEPSPSFTWLEVHRGRKPFGPVQRANAIRHARNLEKLRAAVNAERTKRGLKPTGINILSWYRPEWYNAKIGGARRSQHIYALGTDIALQEIDRLMPWRGGRADFDRVAGRVFSKGGFGQYPAGSRHVDSRGYRARWTSWSR